MGKSVSAFCHRCGWHYDAFAFGCGLINKVIKVPALKKTDHKFIITSNLNDPDLQYYHDSTMYTGSIQGYGIQHRDIHLNPVNNLCPSCGNYTMEFTPVCEWD